jgi:tetratricopeptide (TPR) repeat protein
LAPTGGANRRRPAFDDRSSAFDDRSRAFDDRSSPPAPRAVSRDGGAWSSGARCDYDVDVTSLRRVARESARAGASLAGAALIAALAGAPPTAAAQDVPATATAADTKATSLAEALAAGDAHYARRGEGATELGATPFDIDGAIAEYRRALSIDPDSIDARLRLMRAYFFRGGFCGEMPDAEKQALFDEAKRVAEETVARLDKVLQRRKGRVRLDGQADADAAAEAYVWAGVSWGQWAVFHRVAAAWQGAPGRIRDLAQAVLSIDPQTEQAAAYILLGRLHTEAPRLPLVTGWISRAKGLAYLREGRRLAPQNQALTYFLGSALLELEPAASAEARALLEACATRAPRPDFVAEDLHYARLSRERLAAPR